MVEPMEELETTIDDLLAELIAEGDYLSDS